MNATKMTPEQFEIEACKLLTADQELKRIESVLAILQDYAGAARRSSDAGSARHAYAADLWLKVDRLVGSLYEFVGDEVDRMAK